MNSAGATRNVGTLMHGRVKHDRDPVYEPDRRRVHERTDEVRRTSPGRPPITLAADYKAKHDGWREEMVSAVARRLWEAHGGNDVLNWLEAEMIVNHFFPREPREVSHG